MKLLYFRDIRKTTITNVYGEDEEIDFKELTLLDRLFISAYLTKKDTGTKKTLAEIIFDYDEYDTYTRGNFIDYDNMITLALEKWSNILHWIDVTHKKMIKNGQFIGTIKCVAIDTKDIFAVKNGRTGMALSPIAWKAYALAASKSKKKDIPYLRVLNIYNWLDASVHIEDMDVKKLIQYKRNASQTRSTIYKWVEAVQMKGAFVGSHKECFRIGDEDIKGRLSDEEE